MSCRRCPRSSRGFQKIASSGLEPPDRRRMVICSHRARFRLINFLNSFSPPCSLQENRFTTKCPFPWQACRRRSYRRRSAPLLLPAAAILVQNQIGELSALTPSTCPRINLVRSLIVRLNDFVLVRCVTCSSPPRARADSTRRSPEGRPPFVARVSAIHCPAIPRAHFALRWWKCGSQTVATRR